MSPQWRDWREQAACAGSDTELFFPVGTGAYALAQAARARSICRGCPVVERCAEVAITYGYEGIWGGLDDTERRWLRRGRSGPAPTADGHAADGHAVDGHAVDRHAAAG